MPLLLVVSMSACEKPHSVALGLLVISILACEKPHSVALGKVIKFGEGVGRGEHVK